MKSQNIHFQRSAIYVAAVSFTPRPVDMHVQKKYMKSIKVYTLVI